MKKKQKQNQKTEEQYKLTRETVSQLNEIHEIQLKSWLLKNYPYIIQEYEERWQN